MNRVAIAKVPDYNIDNVRRGLDEMFKLMGFDNENPLGHIIKPGMRVFIKPNWVASRWRESCSHKASLYSVITHPSIIEAVADVAAKALKGKGEILIGDNPSIDADFNELMEFTGIKRLETKYDIPCTILDLRPLVCTDLKYYGKKELMEKQGGDPKGQKEINLGRKSLFYKVNSLLFRGVFTKRSETIAAHSGNNQQYSFSSSLYNADVYISIPKLKTHHKTGVTLNLKGLVGTIAVKNQLVHWRMGFPLIGGDEYPNFTAWVKGFFQKVKSRGSWPKNDTIWRMVVDLYNAFHLKERKVFTVIDGIMGGDGKGPFCPNEKYSGVLLAGDDLLIADIAATRLMGFKPEAIRYLEYLMKEKQINKNDIEVLSKEFPKSNYFDSNDRYLDFTPAELWEEIRINRS